MEGPGNGRCMETAEEAALDPRRKKRSGEEFRNGRMLTMPPAVTLWTRRREHDQGLWSVPPSPLTPQLPRTPVIELSRNLLFLTFSELLSNIAVRRPSTAVRFPVMSPPSETEGPRSAIG